MLKKILFIILIILYSTLFASQKKIDDIASISSISLYNINSHALEETIYTLVKNYPNLKALKIVEHLSGETYISIYKNNKNIFLNQTFDKSLKNYTLYQTKSFYKGEEVGDVYAYFDTNISKISLSKKEILWIKNNPRIKIIKSFDEPPFTINNDKKEGYIYELIEYLISSVGLKIDYSDSFNSYKDMIDSLEQGSNDILSTFPNFLKLKNNSNIIKSKIILKTPFVLITKNSNDKIRNIKNLYGKRIAIVKDYVQDKYINKYPKISKVYVKNNNEGFEALRLGKADYYLNNRANSEYILSKTFTTDLHIVYEFPYANFPPLSLSFAINGKKEELVSILNKALEQMPYKKIQEIQNKWLIRNKDTNLISLNKDEKEWIKLNKIKIGIEQWAPIIYSHTENDINSISGISGDILKLVIKNTGLKVDIINGLWTDILKQFKNKKIDLLPATYYTEERSKYGLYSKAYYKMLDYIYVKDNNYYIHSMKDLKGKKLAIQKNFGLIPKIKQKFPSIQIIETKDLHDSITRVLKGEVDALYWGQIAVQHKIQEDLITGIKAIPQNDFKANQLYYFSSIDKPLLQSILQKGLNSLSKEEINQIKSKWINSYQIKETLNQKNKSMITFIGLLTYQEILIAIFLVSFFTLIVYKFYTKSNILSINFKNFNTSIIVFELSMILFLVFEILTLDRLENALVISHSNKYDMKQITNNIRQNSDTLSYLARTYVITKDARFKKRYLDELSIQKTKRIDKILPFNTKELSKLKQSQKNSNELKKLEIKALKSLKNNKQNEAIKILHSSNYYTAKNNIILPLNEINYLLNNRFSLKITILDKKIHAQFRYILIIGLLFILGNILIYVLLRKKVNVPIAYLSNTIEKIKNRENNIHQKKFYDDEIGKTIEQFFLMQNQIKEQTKDLEKQKEFVQTVLDSQEQIIITINDNVIKSCNKTFLNFFRINSIKEFTKEYICISQYFNTNAQKDYLQIKMNGRLWTDYIINKPKQIHKAMICIRDKEYIFSVTVTNLEQEEGHKLAVFTNITDLEQIRKEVETINKHTQDSIKYASIIQHSLIPSNDLFCKYFSDFFTIWEPKDIVGGDIYLFEELRNDQECLLMMIDCTGHGVPGAFVTMLVKAIERQVISIITNNENIEVSPAWILKYFNQTMKTLLKQENENSVSNAGFDGAILYYNKKEKIVKFAGAELPLFYIKDNEVKMIKGNRHSIGYKKSDSSYEFKEHTFNVEEGMQFYLSTDGYYDQNGGDRGFPFGKKAFLQKIKEYNNYSFNDQKDMLINVLKEYQGKEDRNDDISIIGIKINKES